MALTQFTACETNPVLAALPRDGDRLTIALEIPGLNAGDSNWSDRGTSRARPLITFISTHLCR